ncbi:hypothetical protein MKW92_025003 [Papaver armeniacum]|nr:hypothetical protein MKW92_025003 [Papaver armeniacum]
MVLTMSLNRRNNTIKMVSTSDAIPLKWSHGHLWTAELDVPIDKAITTAKEGLRQVFKSNNNVKRAAADSKSNANDLEVATEENNKSEAITQNQKKEEPSKCTTQQEATTKTKRRMSDEHNKPDKEQVGVGDEKDCQSTNAELTEVLDFPSAEDESLIAKCNWARFDGSTSLEHLKNPTDSDF